MRVLGTLMCFMGGLVIASTVAKSAPNAPWPVQLFFLSLPIAGAIWGWKEFK